MGLREILIILAFAVGAVILFRRLRLTPVLGYLAAGALIGPHALGLIPDVHAVERLAELGVVFLLFAVGLELSLERIAAMRRLVLGLGGLQVAVTAVVLFAGLRVAGMPGPASAVLAGGLALSSTAVVLRLLQERGELPTRAGRAALAILLFQDLAVVPLLTVTPLLGGDGGALLRSVGIALLKAAVALVAIVAAGRLAVRPLLNAVAGSRTPEVFTGIALLLVLGVGWITQAAGLSMALGAFLAGILIAETEYRHQVEGDIEPFRGLLLALFFMSIGMGLDAAALVRDAPVVLGGAALLILVKTMVTGGLALAFGTGRGTAGRLGVLLAGGGEFGFVLFTLAAAGGALTPETASLATLVVAVTMALTPFLAALGARMEKRMEAPDWEAALDGAAEAGARVVVAGFGRVGQTLARLLEEQGVPYLALDMDTARVAAARGRGFPAYFGDARRAEVLRAAGVHRAEAVVITLDDPASAERAVAAVRRENDHVPVLVRAHDTAHSRHLLEAGATTVVPELVEGSLQLAETLLRGLHVPRAEVDGLLERVRDRSYALLEDVVRADHGHGKG